MNMSSPMSSRRASQGHAALDLDHGTQPEPQPGDDEIAKHAVGHARAADEDLSLAFPEFRAARI
jgi:hypothetical protein